MQDGIEIVVIEDEEDILELIEYHLLKAGYEVTGFLRTDKVEAFLVEEDPHLMIVDRNLPGVEGSEFVATLREKGFDIPVIFLTAKDQDDDLIEGFERGGDDYMSKPFNPKELVVRVAALLRRNRALPLGEKLRHKDLTLDLERREVSVSGRRVELTPLEVRLLEVFFRNKHRILGRDELYETVWGGAQNVHDKTINVALARVKKKIDPENTKEYFEAVRGVGYRLK